MQFGHIHRGRLPALSQIGHRPGRTHRPCMQLTVLAPHKDRHPTRRTQVLHRSGVNMARLTPRAVQQQGSDQPSDAALRPCDIANE
jgi:hypothetical protein